MSCLILHLGSCVTASTCVLARDKVLTWHAASSRNTNEALSNRMDALDVLAEAAGLPADISTILADVDFVEASTQQSAVKAQWKEKFGR